LSVGAEECHCPTNWQEFEEQGQGWIHLLVVADVWAELSQGCSCWLFRQKSHFATLIRLAGDLAEEEAEAYPAPIPLVIRIAIEQRPE
jgi:hypothetical protein